MIIINTGTNKSKNGDVLANFFILFRFDDSKEQNANQLLKCIIPSVQDSRSTAILGVGR